MARSGAKQFDPSHSPSPVSESLNNPGGVVIFYSIAIMHMAQFHCQWNSTPSNHEL
jgi:hypothetical protein